MTSAAPAKAEATDASITFDFDGETYTVDPARTKDLDTLEAFEDGRIITAIKALIGDKQYRAFRAKPERDADDLGRFVDALQAALGISGN